MKKRGKKSYLWIWFIFLLLIIIFGILLFNYSITGFATAPIKRYNITCVYSGTQTEGPTKSQTDSYIKVNLDLYNSKTGKYTFKKPILDVCVKKKVEKVNKYFVKEAYCIKKTLKTGERRDSITYKYSKDWTLCEDGCINGACIKSPNIPEIYNPYNFKFFDLKYYINSRSVQGCFVYNGNEANNIYSLFKNKNLVINITIITNNNSISKSNYYLVNDNIWNMFLNNNSHCDSKLGVGFYEDEVNQIKGIYQNGNIPYTIQFILLDDLGNIQTVYNQTSYFYLDLPYDNRVYQIGVIQVLPPEMKLENLKLCFNGGSWSNNPYYFNEINVNCQILSGWDVKKFNFKNLFLSENQFNYIKNVSFVTQESLDSTKIYSFKYIGKYWENLLANHGLENKDTSLGKNPKFNITFLTPLYKENTLHSDDNPIVRRFFSSAVAENNLNISKFDFVIYLQYIPKNTPQPYFSQGFSKLNAGYIPLFLGTDQIIVNRKFITLVHEMGHMLFPLGDLYSSYNIFYPEGVPDPLNFPQRKACLMAQSYGYKRISDNLVERYDLYSDSNIFPSGIDFSYVADPKNYILCVKDIFNILKQKENPNCSLNEFYSGNCTFNGVNCTSEKYLSCTRKVA